MREILRRQLDRLIKNIDGRTQSERLVVLVMSIGVLFLVYLTIAFDPIRAGVARVEGQIRSVQGQIASQQATHAEMEAASLDDPSRFANERMQVVERELQQLDGEISSLAGDLITPNQMTEILGTVLGEFPGLELVSFSNTVAEPLRAGISASSILAAAESTLFGGGNDSEGDGQVYAHGIQLEFQGDFLTTLKYLLFLENIGGSFFWDSLTFERLEWPIAAIRLEIHTLSTDEGFIGV